MSLLIQVSHMISISASASIESQSTILIERTGRKFWGYHGSFFFRRRRTFIRIIIVLKSVKVECSCNCFHINHSKPLRF
jgi:hypothetical protein